MTERLSTECIYTTIKLSTLIGDLRNNEAREFTEGKRWAGGAELLQRARNKKEILPIIFSDANEGIDLLWWGEILDIRIGNKGTRGTTVVVHRLTAIPPRDPERLVRVRFKPVFKRAAPRTIQELIVLSTNAPIEEGHIRPYVLCRTPDFLSVDALPPVKKVPTLTR